MWKLITEPKTYVEKICNECGKVIDTFDATHPLTQYMIFDLNLNEKSDLSVLDFGMQPYHWCPTKPNNHCLIPMKTTLRETRQQEVEEEMRKQVKNVKTIPEAFVNPPPPLPYAPYKDPPKKHHGLRGRPPRLVLPRADLEEEKKKEKHKEDEPKSSV